MLSLCLNPLILQIILIFTKIHTKHLFFNIEPLLLQIFIWQPSVKIPSVLRTIDAVLYVNKSAKVLFCATVLVGDINTSLFRHLNPTVSKTSCLKYLLQFPHFLQNSLYGGWSSYLNEDKVKKMSFIHRW